MLISSSKPIRLTLPADKGQPERVHVASVPTVAQMQSVLELDPPDDAARVRETPGAQMRRNARQAALLLTPPPPDTFSPLAWLAWWRQGRAARRFLRRLDFRQQTQVFNAMLLAAKGVDLNNMDAMAQAMAEAKKKAQK